MTEKQKRCIDYICNTLNIKYTGTTAGDAWQFIHDYKPKADSKRNAAFTNPDLEILHLMEKTKLPMSRVHFPDDPEHEDFFLRDVTDEDIAAICPGGIHCADDIKESGWLFAMHSHPFLPPAFEPPIFEEDN